MAAVTSKTVDKCIETGVTLVDFGAPWCGPCRSQEPVLHELEEIFRDRASILKVNIDDNRDLAHRYRVQSIPTLVVFKDGKEVKRLVGLQSGKTLAGHLENALK
ncbi:MAG: thioredoxin [Pseudomonadota bacterium]